MLLKVHSSFFSVKNQVALAVPSPNWNILSQFLAVSTMARIKSKNQLCWRRLNVTILSFPFRFDAMRTQSPESMTSDSVSFCICVGWHKNFLWTPHASFNYDGNHPPLRLNWLWAPCTLQGASTLANKNAAQFVLWKWLPITSPAVNLSKKTSHS